MNSSPSQNLETPPSLPMPAEPCPTPLSTREVLESFERDSRGWEIETPGGFVRGQTLGDGPPLYFLNSLEGTSELFRLLAWLLREEFRCVLFDPASNPHRSSQTRGDISSLPEVEQLFAVADWHEDETFLVYGSGYGGWTALAGMLSEGRRFRGAILQGAYAQRRFKFLERLLLALGRRSKRFLKDVPGWKTVFEQNHHPWFPPFDAPRWELFQQLAGNIRVSDVAQRALSLRNVKFADRLPEIVTPVLCLKTEGEGKILQQRQEELEQSLPNCRAEWLQDSGQVPHWTHPHRVAKLIRQFAASLSERE